LREGGSGKLAAKSLPGTGGVEKKHLHGGGTPMGLREEEREPFLYKDDSAIYLLKKQYLAL